MDNTNGLSGGMEAVRILCVDDEPRVLDGLENHLAMHFDVHVATSGSEGLNILREQDPFAVVISDFRMPEMDGATFLKKVRESFPDSTRLLLTGQADIETASAAINKGGIFRYLSKPCSPPDLLEAVRDGIRHHQLIVAERELLENTLSGTIKVLTEVVGLTASSAMDRSSPLSSYVRHMCRKLNIVDAWQYEVAATLAKVGCITLPPDTLTKLFARQSLSNQELEMLEEYPAVGQRLLSNIPRLEIVAKIIGSQNNPPTWPSARPSSTDEETIALGANLLAVAMAFDELVMVGRSHAQAANTLCKRKGRLPPKLVLLLRDFRTEEKTDVIRTVCLSDLRTFMVLDEDVVTARGHVLLKSGRHLSQPLIERLRHFAKGVGVEEPIRVRVLR